MMAHTKKLFPLAFLILFSHYLPAENLLLGVKDVKDKDFNSAITNFSKDLLPINTSNWKQQSELRMWLGFSYLSKKDNVSKAKKLIIEAVCASTPKNYNLGKHCKNEARYSKNIDTIGELDRTIAGLSMLATDEWDRNSYLQSFRLSTLINQILIASSEMLNRTPPLYSFPYDHNYAGKIDYSRFHSLDEIENELSRQENIVKKVTSSSQYENYLYNEKNFNVDDFVRINSIQNIYKKRALLKVYDKLHCFSGLTFSDILERQNFDELKNGKHNNFLNNLMRIEKSIDKNIFCKNKSIPTRRTRLAKKTNHYHPKEINKQKDNHFHQLSRPLMCSDKMAKVGQSLNTISNFQQSIMVQLLENNRGNRILNSTLTNSPTFYAILDYFDTLREYQKLVGSRSYTEYLNHASLCANRPGLRLNLMLSLQGAIKRSELLDSDYNQIVKVFDSINSVANRSPDNLSWELAMIHYYMANHDFLSGNINQSIQHYRKALVQFSKAGLNQSPIGLQSYANIINEFAKILAKHGESTQEIYSAIESLKSDYNADRFNLTQKTSGDFSILTSAVDREFNIQDASFQKLSSQIGNKTELYSHPAYIDYKKIMAKSSKDIKTRIEDMNILYRQYENFRNSSLSSTGVGNNPREKRNYKRQLHLNFARILLSINDILGAEHWLAKEQDKGISVLSLPEAYSTKVLSLEHYVRAIHAKKINQSDSALKHYLHAIEYWYLYPRKVDEFTYNNLYESPVYLLEEAAEYALSNGHIEMAFYYFEMARYAYIDSEVLYAPAGIYELKHYQSKLERDYNRLISTAKDTASKNKQLKDFKNTHSDTLKLKKYFNIPGESPLLYLKQALPKYHHWISEKSTHKFLKYFEDYEISWKRNQLFTLRSRKFSRKRYTKKFTEIKSAFSIPFFNDRKAIANHPIKTIEQLKNNIHFDETTLVYWIGNQKTYAFSITNNSVKSHIINTKNLTKNIYSMTTTSEFDYNAAKKLYRLLVSPFQSNLKNSISIVLNGALQNVPFATLINPSTEKFLGEKHPIRYSGNVQKLYNKTDKNKKVAHNQFLLIATENIDGEDRLDFSTLEIQSISPYFPSHTLKGKLVNRTLFEKELNNYAAVHFAGHGKLNSTLPDLSHLILNNRNTQDSVIHVKDIRQLDLSNLDLVVLAACHTGNIPKFIEHIEFNSLNNAFLNAGAASVIATLGVVNDETSQILMERFYREIAKGERKDKALQNAQRYLQKQKIGPKQWGAFILNGSAHPVRLTTKENSLL